MEGLRQLFVDKGINPSLNALGSMIMGLLIVILILANRFGGVKFERV